MHLGKKREEVFRLGHEQGLVGVDHHRLVLLAVHEGREQVLVVHDADDTVDVLVEHGQARVAGAAHAVDGLTHGFRVLHKGHVHARLHDLVHGHVP